MAAAHALAITAIGSAAEAQVNTEKMRRRTASEGFSGHVEGSAAFRAGNVESLRVVTGARVQYETFYPAAERAGATGTSTSGGGAAALPDIRDLVFAVGSLTYSEKSRSAYVNKGFAHLRWTRMWLRWLGSELFNQYQFNEFIKLNRRIVGGAGIRLAVARSDAIEIYFGSGYMLEDERLSVDPPEEIDALAHRWTNYLAVVLRLLGDDLGLVNTVYAQPRFDDFADYRILSEGEITVAVTEVLSFGFGANLRYDSRPPTGVETLDVSLSNKLRLEF